MAELSRRAQSIVSLLPMLISKAVVSETLRDHWEVPIDDFPVSACHSTRSGAVAESHRLMSEELLMKATSSLADTQTGDCGNHAFERVNATQKEFVPAGENTNLTDVTESLLLGFTSAVPLVASPSTVVNFILQFVFWLTFAPIAHLAEAIAVKESSNKSPCRTQLHFSGGRGQRMTQYFVFFLMWSHVIADAGTSADKSHGLNLYSVLFFMQSPHRFTMLI